MQQYSFALLRSRRREDQDPRDLHQDEHILAFDLEGAEAKLPECADDCIWELRAVRTLEQVL